jgi:carotenoid cleavage dioxygenase-like enzyme
MSAIETSIATKPGGATDAKALGQPQRPYRKGFDTLSREVAIDRLPLEGELPAWLQGTLVRTGPARFEVGSQKFRHWFDGLAMLHAFAFSGANVSYRNRFLHSRAYDAATRDGRISYAEFATDPCRSIFKRVAAVFDAQITDNGNVNVSRIAGHYVAMTETPLPIEFDRATLDTAGVFDYDGDKHRVHHTTAHPHYDAGTKEAFNYFAHFSRVSSYNAYRVAGESGRRQVFGRASVKEPGYIHSFGLTENYFVLVEFPYVVNPLKLLFSGKPFIENFEWKPERPARFLVFRRSDGGLETVSEADAFFAFHHVNAFEDGDKLQVDISAYDDATVVKSLYLDHLRGGDGQALNLPPLQLRRYTVPLTGAKATSRVIVDQPLELPRINYARNGRDYAFAYFASSDPARPDDFVDRLVKVDVRNGATWSWSEDSCYPGEAVFVASPNAEAEDDGVLLSVVLDTRRSSFLLVLDASTFAEIARATVPHIIPFGFHGQYFN